VSLSALPQVLTYYPKVFGFEHRHNCEDGDKILIPEELFEKISK
jgi:hypothetical protein